MWKDWQSSRNVKKKYITFPIRFLFSFLCNNLRQQLDWQLHHFHNKLNQSADIRAWYERSHFSTENIQSRNKQYADFYCSAKNYKFFDRLTIVLIMSNVLFCSTFIFFTTFCTQNNLFLLWKVFKQDKVWALSRSFPKTFNFLINHVSLTEIIQTWT